MRSPLAIRACFEFLSPVCPQDGRRYYESSTWRPAARTHAPRRAVWASRSIEPAPRSVGLGAEWRPKRRNPEPRSQTRWANRRSEVLLRRRTLVATMTGLRPIEEIEPGDQVCWSRNEAIGETALRRSQNAGSGCKASPRRVGQRL